MSAQLVAPAHGTDLRVMTDGGRPLDSALALSIGFAPMTETLKQEDVDWLLSQSDAYRHCRSAGEPPAIHPPTHSILVAVSSG